MSEARQEEDSSKLRIDSVNSLVSVLSALTAGGGERWYRGHRDETWLLEASTFRPGAQQHDERGMLARFRQEAAAAGLQFAFDEWGWITFAQHHGLPTRLLDWSQSPLVALYFAAEETPTNEPNGVEPDGAFFALDPHQLNVEAGDNDGGHPRLLAELETRMKDYLPGEDSKNKVRPRSVVAPMTFDRIRFQSGTFTVEQKSDVPGSKEPLRSSASVTEFLVPAESKRNIREELEALGFNEMTIYRDLDRIAARIKGTRARSRH